MAKIEAPTAWQNITDSFVATAAAALDQCRACAVWIGWQFARQLGYGIEKLTGRKFGDTLQNTPHSHMELEAQPGLAVSYRDGVCVPCSVVSIPFSSYDRDYRLITLDEVWTVVAKVRGLVAGARAVACEVRYATPLPNHDTVSWKILSFDADDSANVTAGNEDHYIAETAGTSHTSPQWHTINGQLDGAGGNTKKLQIDVNTTPPTYGDAMSWREFWIYAQQDNPGTVYLHLYHVHIFEVLDQDL